MVVSPFAVMLLFKYFKREAAVGRGEFLPEETDRSTSIANQEVRAVVDEAEAKPKRRKVEPRVYSAETRAAIGISTVILCTSFHSIMNVCDHKPHKIIITHKRKLLNTCKSHEFRIA